MNDPLLMRCFEGFGDLLGDGQGLVELNRPTRDPLREILSFDELHHEGFDAVCVLQPVDGRNVRMIQGGQCLGFALESGHALRVGRECLR